MALKPSEISDAQQLIAERDRIGLQLLALHDDLTITLGKGGNTHIVQLKEGPEKAIKNTLETHMRQRVTWIERTLKNMGVDQAETEWGDEGELQRPGEPAKRKGAKANG